MNPTRPYHPVPEPEAPPASPVDADLALVLACLAWPDWTSRDTTMAIGDPSYDFVLKLWNWIEASWLRRANALWENESAAGLPDRKKALDRLRAMHVAAARLDLDRVHSSWLARALREETPAVAAIAGRHGADKTKAVARRALRRSSGESPSPAHLRAEVVAWVLSLWTERLVGGRTETRNDPPEIVALASLSPLETLRLFRMWGFVKLVAACLVPSRRVPRPLLITRQKWIETELVKAQPGLKDLVKADIKAQAKLVVPARRVPALLGELGLARLIKDHDPFRLRWALQNVPYPIAKHIRATIPKKIDPGLNLEAHEALLLKIAWRRLNLEHRIKHRCPAPPLGSNPV